MARVRWPLLAFGTAVLLAGSRSFAGSTSHTLHYFYTSIWEPGEQLPQFIAVGQLDGIIGGQYDSYMMRATPRVPWMRKAEEERPDFWDWYSEKGRRAELGSRLYLENIRKLYNQSEGVHTWQTMYGCKVSEDGGSPRGYLQYSYNGRDFLSFDKETLTWTGADPQAQIIKRNWDSDLDRSRDTKAFLEEECVEWLQKFLKYGSEALLRKEAPEVKVSRVVGYDGLETLICRADGFYPKEIDATWKRDGQVWEQDIFRGGVVPNSDGTFHTSLHIEVDPKEEARYQCHVEHDGLVEPLDLAWEEPASTPVALIVVGVLIALAALLIALVLVYIRNRCETAYEKAPAGKPDPGGSAQA